MKFSGDHYGKKYAAPNSRETVRRQSVHQFLQAMLIIENPDDPTRPPNSGKTGYKISQTALKLVQSYASSNWDKNLTKYMKNVPSLLKSQYAKERDMTLIPLKVSDDIRLKLSAGGQNILVKKIIDEFTPRFTHGSCPPIHRRCQKKIHLS